MVVAITLVLMAMTGKAMFSAVYSFRVSSSARQLAAAAQLTRVKGMASNVRYRVNVALSGNNYRIERFNQSTSLWEVDPKSDWVRLPPGVTFNNSAPVSLPTAPPGMGATPDQASDMTFNTRGLLVGPSGLLNSACVYIQGQVKPPYAVCTTLPGATSVFRYAGSTWEKVL